MEGHNDSSEQTFARQLEAAGLVATAELQRARTYQAERNCSLIQSLIELGLLPERTVAQQMSICVQAPIAAPEDYPDLPALDGKV